MNAVEVAYLHYAVGRTPTDAANRSFWQEEYLVPAKSLLNTLLNKNVMYLDDDLKKVLKNKKVSDLKSILRSYEFKLSGNKSALIERIVENKDIVDVESLNLEPILQVTDDYAGFYSATEFINYGFNNYYVSIFELYNYFQSSPDKKNHEIILETMIKKYKSKLDDPLKYDAQRLSESISIYYLTKLNDIEKGYYYLNCSVMIHLMQDIEYYRKRLSFYDRDGFDMNHLIHLFKIYGDNFEYYEKLIYTNQIQAVNVGADMYSHTKHLPYKDEDRKLVSNYVFHYFKNQKEAEDILRHEIEKQYYSNNERDSAKKLDAHETDFN